MVNKKQILLNIRSSVIKDYLITEKTNELQGLAPLEKLG